MRSVIIRQLLISILYTGVAFAYFQVCGYCPETITILKKLLSGVHNWFAPSLSKRRLIKSGPGAFVIF